MLHPWRAAALILLAAWPVTQPVLARTGQPAKARAAVAAKPVIAPRPWLYENSDVPIDPAWTFGTLENGLRYAIRRNGVPPGQVSIRVRADVGSLMERPDERGFAHFIEHLTFRGSREVPDGEAKRVWQRLGATFGSDSNAQTTPTATTFALDLPQADDAGLDESMKILAGMLAEPNIVPQAVEAERAVVLAEMRESYGPAMVVGNAAREFYFAGQAKGAGTPLPDFGQPDPKAPGARVLVEAQSPVSVGLAWLRPWHPKADTIVYNQGKLTDTLALQLINRRLEQAAQRGASYVQASVDQQDVSRSVDGTFVTITPIENDWQRALADVRAIIADAMATPPDKADIDREYAQLETAFAIAADNADTEASSAQAETLIGAVDIRETTVTPQAALDIFRSARPMMTPGKMLESTRRMFSGTAQRALLTLRAPEAGADQALAAALAAPVAPAKDVRLAAGSVTMDSLPKLPPPGKVVSRQAMTSLRIEKIGFANGVTLILFANNAEREKVRINVRFGNGQQSFAPRTDAALWAAPYVLAANGIGNLGQRELDDLTNGRRMEFKFSVGEDAFKLAALSRPADYRDQLRLYATKLAYPRWDPAPLARIKAVFLAADSASRSSPDALLNRDLHWLLRNRDLRFAPPSPERVRALTPENFRATWEPLLASGPIEVQIFGDVKADEAIKAVAETFGALPPREAKTPPSRNRKMRFPRHVRSPVILRHEGAAEQAAAVMAWPTGAGYKNLRESRQLETVSQIINDRLFERLRSMDGAAYSPSVSNYWPLTFDKGGYIVVSSQIKPERIALFATMVQDIARDLAEKPVSKDELQRTLVPMRQLLERASTGNAFWMAQMEGESRDPGVLPAMRSFGSDLLQVTPADIQRLAAKYLVERKSWSAIVLSRDTAVPPDLAAIWPRVGRAGTAAR
jgi:zinc protease